MEPLNLQPMLMKTTSKTDRKRQGQLLAFSMSGAMALALSSCNHRGTGQTMIAPPSGFSTSQAAYLTSTNDIPTASCVYAGGGGGGAFLTGRGYYPVYGYPGYFYRPSPGSTVELVEGGSSSYSASSPDAARDDVARGGFGESGGESGGHGGGEGGGE